MLVALSLAEMASAYPTTAGPLEWTFRLAPRKMAHFLVSIVTVVSGRLNGVKDLNRTNQNVRFRRS
jgi:hypothetical protein